MKESPITVKILTVIIFAGGAVQVGVDGGGTDAGVSWGLLQAVSSSSAQMNPTTPRYGLTGQRLGNTILV